MVGREVESGVKARRGDLNGVETIFDYGSVREEIRLLRTRVGLLDLSARGRLCLLGSDRLRFLNGQVTADLRRLEPGSGRYTLITDRKGILRADAVVYRLAEELLLDVEPGVATGLMQRFQDFIVADEVDILDAGLHYDLWSVQGPSAEAWLDSVGIARPEDGRYVIESRTDPAGEEFYLACNRRTPAGGYDLFLPRSAENLRKSLLPSIRKLGGGLCGWQSLESLRIEAAAPRFPVDMTPAVLAPELGLEEGTIGYDKGCYLGQEILNRIHSVGRLNRKLVAVDFARELGDRSGAAGPVVREGKTVGRLTSSAWSDISDRTVGLALVRRECAEPGTALSLAAAGESRAAGLEVSPRRLGQGPG